MLYFKCITFFETCLDTVYDTRPHQFTIHFLFCLFIFYTCSDTFVGSASFLIFPGCSITITSPHNHCDPQNFCALRYIYNTIILWSFLFLCNLLVFVFASNISLFFGLSTTDRSKTFTIYTTNITQLYARNPSSIFISLFTPFISNFISKTSYSIHTYYS